MAFGSDSAFAATITYIFLPTSSRFESLILSMTVITMTKTALVNESAAQLCRRRDSAHCWCCQLPRTHTTLGSHRQHSGLEGPHYPSGGGRASGARDGSDGDDAGKP